MNCGDQNTIPQGGNNLLVDRFPRMIFKEKKVVFSREQMEELLEEGRKINKMCLVSLYSYEEVRDKKIVPESAVIDRMLWEGTLEKCEEICDRFKQYKRMIVFDGEKYLAIVFKESSLDELAKEGACTDLEKMILLPGYPNLRTGKICKVVKEYGRQV